MISLIQGHWEPGASDSDWPRQLDSEAALALWQPASARSLESTAPGGIGMMIPTSRRPEPTVETGTGLRSLAGTSMVPVGMPVGFAE